MNLNLASKYEYEEEEKQEFTRFDRTYPEILVFQPAYDDDRVITINPELLSTVDILSVLFKKLVEREEIENSRCNEESTMLAVYPIN